MVITVFITDNGLGDPVLAGIGYEYNGGCMGILLDIVLLKLKDHDL